MNILSKFKSIFKDSQQPYSRDEKIGYLANELIKELKASGRSIGRQEIAKDFGSFTLWVFRLGSEDEYINIENSGKWSVKIKPTFKEF